MFHFYIHNVSADVILVELRNLHETSEPRPLFNPQRSLALNLLTITGYKCWVFSYCYFSVVRIKLTIFWWLSFRSLGNRRLKPLRHVSNSTAQTELLGLVNLMFLHHYKLRLLRKEGGSGFNNIEDSIDASIRRLEDNIRECRERLITTITNNTRINRRREHG